jgi:hypothetical protein
MLANFGIGTLVAVRVMAWFPEWFSAVRNAGIMVVGWMVPTVGFAVKGLLLPASSDSDSSCPALCRASTSFLMLQQDVDGRDKPGHDGG